MGVIKSNSVPTSLQPFSMKSIESQAKTILLRARQQADQLLAAAQAEAADLRKLAKAAGHAEGHEQGLKAGREEGTRIAREQTLEEQRGALSSALSALTASLVEIDAHRRELEASAVRDVIELAIAIAERVTKRQGVLDAQVVVGNVTEAMKLVSHCSDVRIAMHPAQKATVEELLPRLKMQFPNFEHVAMVVDESIGPGGCRVFTLSGQVDATLDEQLRRMVADLLPDPVREAS